MSEDDNKPNPDSGANPDEGKKTDKDPIPYDRFKKVNDELKDLRDWKLAQEKEAEARTKKEQDAEAARLKEQGEYKTLAEQAEAKLKEYEPYKQRAEAYEKALLAQLESVRKQLKDGGVSDTVLDLLNAKPPAEQLEYIAQKMDELLPQEDKGKPANIRSYPPSGKSNGSGKTKDQLVSERKKTGIYGM